MLDWEDLLARPPAPAPSHPPVPAAPQSVAPMPAEAIVQVGYTDLANLAGKLVRRKSERQQAIGLALAKALRGEPFASATSGVRNSTLLAIAGDILEEFPFAELEPIAQLFSACLDRMRLDAEAAGQSTADGAPTLDQFRSMLARKQGQRQLQHHDDQHTLDLFAAASQALVARGETPAPLPLDAWGVPQGDARADLRTLIVRETDSSYHLRSPAEAQYTARATSATALRIDLQRLYLDRGIPLNILDDTGEMIPTDKILRAYSCNARHVIYDYSATSTEFDSLSGVLRVGYTPGRLQDGTTIPERADSTVEAWLRTLAGGTDDHLIALYDWIAASAQRYIARPATALVLVGAPSAGKTAFADALAMTWGVHKAVNFAIAVDRFNGALAHCPVWLADEEMPPELTGERFRTIIQDKERYIELKGRERQTLKGCARIVFALNGLDKLRLGATSRDAADAIAARLTVFHAQRERACERALADVREAATNAGTTEQVLVARHLRAVQSLEPREQRFYGGRDAGGALRAVLGSSVDHCPAVFEALADYVLDPQAWERTYSASSILNDGRQYPVVTEIHGGEPTLAVYPDQLAQRIHVEAWRVRKALEPFVLERKRLSFGPRGQNVRGMYWLLDVARLEPHLNLQPSNI